MWLDFEPSQFDAAGLDEIDPSVPMPVRGPTMFMWIHDQDAAEVADDLEAGLEAVNRPLHGASFSYAVGSLVRSVENDGLIWPHLGGVPLV